MGRRGLIASSLWAALPALLVAAGCARRAGPPPPPPRLVLLYATCTLNRSCLSPYDPRVPYTPNIAAFAREAVTFRRHHTETDQSGPAYAALFSGAQVDHHGLYRHPARLRDDLYLLAEAFADGGWDTHFWSGHPMASADLNYGQGVPPGNVHVRRPGVADLYSITANDSEFAAILARLKADPSYRAFVQVNFTITHGPYTGVDPRAVAAFRREYPGQWPNLSDGEIAACARLYAAHYLRLQWDFPALRRELDLSPGKVEALDRTIETYYKVNVRLLDHCFGRIVDSIRAAGLLGQSLIAFTADHGETLGRKSALFHWTHGGEVAPDAIQVPLILRLPEGPGAPRSYEGVSRSIDVYPTLAGLSGVRVPSDRGVAGRDLSAAVRGRVSPPALRAFAHTTPLSPELVTQFRGWYVLRFHPSTDVDLIWTAVRDGDTYARRRRDEQGRWRVEAFDLGRDPDASTDRFDGQNTLHRDLARELEAYKALLVARHDEHQREQSLHAGEVRGRLRALGYIQ